LDESPKTFLDRTEKGAKEGGGGGRPWETKSKVWSKPTVKVTSSAMRPHWEEMWEGGRKGSLAQKGGGNAYEYPHHRVAKTEKRGWGGGGGGKIPGGGERTLGLVSGSASSNALLGQYC